MTSKTAHPLHAINLQDLGIGFPGNTPAQGMAMAEAASLCLENQKHTSPSILKVIDAKEVDVELAWNAVGQQIRQGHNDLQDATRDGAYGVAFLVMKHFKNMIPILQSRKGTGFDYFVSEAKPTSLSAIERTARLEVSGVLAGGRTGLNKRVREKEDQTKVSDDMGIPAIIVVVEFSCPITKVVERCLSS